jgi:methyltransferase family protein
VAIEQKDIDFINTKFSKVEGWCMDDAALLTVCLMQAQTKSGYDSAILEIGVYKGKYLSVLYNRAQRTAQSVVGIDTFQWSSREDVVSTFASLFGSVEHLGLVTHDSSRLEPAHVMEMLGGRRASFISVDGDHAASVVRHDLILSKQVLSEGGIIAVDDVLNPKAIGVSEGFYRFFLESGEQSLRPFAYCANKLFLAESPYDEIYKKAIEALPEDMPNLPMVQEFNRQLRLGRHYVEQELLGSSILIF